MRKGHWNSRVGRGKAYFFFFFNFRSMNLLITVDFFQSMNNTENKQI